MRTTETEPILDPGVGVVWYSQHEQQMLTKKDDDEDDEDLDDEEDDDDDDEDDDPDADKTPEELAAELKAVRASLKGANGSSAKRRAKIKTLTADLEKARKGAAPKGDDDKGEPVDQEALKEQGREEARAAAKLTRISDKAELALSRAGVTPEKLVKAARLLDLEDLDLNDDGTLDGFDEQLTELKKDWPELFGRTRRKRESVGGGADRDGREESRRSKAKTASELGAAKILGRG